MFKEDKVKNPGIIGLLRKKKYTDLPNFSCLVFSLFYLFLILAVKGRGVLKF